MIDASIVLCTTRELLKSLPRESWRSAEALIAKYAARIARLDPETFRLMPAFRDLRLPPADSPWILAYTRAVGPVLYPRVEAAYLAACPPVEAEIERRKRAGLPPYDRERPA